ncbi:hypothetical protein [Alistipes sp.]|uniref:hypothetical protein n=1 Tax=Alistipes sp. TaxID=1872444 RepID=UPI003AF086A1
MIGDRRYDVEGAAETGLDSIAAGLGIRPARRTGSRAPRPFRSRCRGAPPPASRSRLKNGIRRRWQAGTFRT